MRAPRFAERSARLPRRTAAVLAACFTSAATAQPQEQHAGSAAEHSSPSLERREPWPLRPDPLPGLAVEGFGLADNLMIPGALLHTGGCPVVAPDDGRDRAFDALDVFERCVALAAGRMGCGPHGA